jgi:peroxiredoxin/uncharacterized membrane protein YphA (DoxX/SURF4 family)
MGVVLLVCRLGLAVVFLTAGLGKLLDRAGTQAAVVEFGVGRGGASMVAASLPVLEIAVGVALVPNVTARFGAVGAGLLLAAFTVAIGRSLARGQTPDCHCFGQVHSRPVGRGTVARNAALFACAAFIAVAGWESPGASATSWIAKADAAWIVAATAGVVIVASVAFQVWFSPRMLARKRRTHSRLDALESAARAGIEPSDLAVANAPGRGLRVGTPAPDFELGDIDGRQWSLAPLLGDARPVLLVFSAAGCVPCQALLPELAGWQRQYRDRLTIALIARGERARNERTAREYGLDLVLLDERGDRAAEPYKAYGTPMAVLVAPDATIASRTVAGVDAIAALVAHATRPVPDTTARIGEPAPALILGDLAGNQVPLADLYREPIVALFWRPNCGYCRQMLPLLHAIEQRPPAGVPRVVVISGGDAEQVREQAIRSTVLLDPDGQAMRAFGAPGTPMAVLVENGRIATDIHAGAGAVLELITTDRAPAAG